MKDWLTNRIVKLAGAMVRPGFIVFFICLLAVWIGWNVFSPWKIDRWPFQGLNLFMSALAGVQAAVVGIAVAIQSEKHDKKYDRLIEQTEANVEKIAQLEETAAARLENIEQKLDANHFKREEA